MKYQKPVPNGNWVTMLTPFDSNYNVDCNALEALIEWYIANKIDGLFAVCQSSEMFFLSQDERYSIARFVIQKSAGRIPVVVSGHVSDGIDEQITELRRMASLESEAVVLVTNRLAAQNESDEVWKENAKRILEAIPDCPFGLYECPSPYKRILSPELLKWCADTGRFVFLKDTCCDLKQIQCKLEAVKGTGLKVFNANAATLLDSMKIGASGFCGVMLNFFPKLYSEICKNYSDTTGGVEKLQDLSCVLSMIELQMYPINAKYHLKKLGLPMEIYTKSRDDSQWNTLRELETNSLRRLYDNVFGA